jgi:hypothetical protein
MKTLPKAQAYQQYMKEAYTSHIAPEVAERWAAKILYGSNVQTTKDPTGPFRTEVARAMFAELSQEEREGYRQRAKQEAEEAQKAYEEALTNPPSRSPEARQK